MHVRLHIKSCKIKVKFMTLDKLQNGIKSLFFYLILTIICISLFPAANLLRSRLPNQDQISQSQSQYTQALDTLLKPMTVTALQQPLPQGYRIETADGEIVFISPASLLSVLLKDEVQSISSGWKEQPETIQAVLMRIIGLHSALLEKMGDRTESMTDEELSNSCWLTAQDCEETARSFTSADLKAIDADLEAIAGCASIYFLSNNGNLAGQCGNLTLSQIYERLQGGEKPFQIWNQMCGEGFQLESAHNP